MKPILAITMGDPAGTGPEIVSKALAADEVWGLCRPLVVGDYETLQRAGQIVGISQRWHQVEAPEQARFQAGDIDLLQTGDVDHSRLAYGRVDPMAGKAAYDCVVRATQMALDDQVDAVVTSALNKEALNLAGYHYTGHTEILADLCGVSEITMMLVAGSFRVTHVSTHCSLREAIERVRQERILEVVRLTHHAVRQLGVPEPRLAIAGLNPHAGEGGLFGDEETKEITPAIEVAARQGTNVYPMPLPPDTVFYRMQQGQFDGVVAMYHDQGHIAAKLVDFAGGVNVTLGLPIIRTSVDHGTAFGKAGKGTADPSSLLAAIRLAAELCQTRSRE